MVRVLKWILPSVLKVLSSKVASVVHEDWKDRDRVLSISYVQAIVHVTEIGLYAILNPKKALHYIKSYAMLKAAYTLCICTNGRNMQYWLEKEGKQSEEFQTLARLQSDLHTAQELNMRSFLHVNGEEVRDDK